MDQTLLKEYIERYKKLNKQGITPRENNGLDLNEEEVRSYQEQKDPWNIEKTENPFYVNEEISGPDIFETGGCLYRKICLKMGCEGRVCKIYKEGNPEKTPNISWEFKRRRDSITIPRHATS